jgi:hypothetical protein
MVDPGSGFQRKLVDDFEGGEMTGDAGLVVLREFDERLELTRGSGSWWAIRVMG